MLSHRNLQLIFFNEANFFSPIVSFLHDSHTVPKKHILLVYNLTGSINDVGVTLKHI